MCIHVCFESDKIKSEINTFDEGLTNVPHIIPSYEQEWFHLAFNIQPLAGSYPGAKSRGGVLIIMPLTTRHDYNRFGCWWA